MSQLRTPRELNFNAENLAEEWRRWEKSFKIYYAAAELASKTVSTQVAILLNCAGEAARDIFDNFGLAFDSEDTTCDVVLAKFRDYCNPRRKPAFESYKFWQRQQAEGEPFDKWLTELRIIASNCEFGTSMDRQLRDKILFGTNDDTARQRMLEEDNLTLAKAINICHSIEATKAQLCVMTTRSATDTVTVHELHNEGKSEAVRPSRFANCRNCGSKHQPRQCPAYGKTCYKCGKRNHFAALCRSILITRPNAKQVNEVTTGTTSQSDPSVLRVQSLCGRKKRNFVGSKMQSTLQVNGTHTCTFKLDTGAEANILPFDLYKQVCSSLLRPTSTVLCGFGNAVIKPLGTIGVAVCDREGREFPLLFYVTDIIDLPILGEHACDLLNLVKKVDIIDESKGLTLDGITHNFAAVFTGRGLYQEKYHITLKKDAKPVIQQPRHIAYALRPKLKEVLDGLSKDGIIADVDCPTEWISNLVVVEKKDKSLRLCLDPKPLNAAILRERYVIPTPADVQSQLSGKRLFSVIDMKDGYWHVGLSEESSYLTTFHTPWGRKRFRRMPFGICSASEVMQKRNETVFGDIGGVYVIADDIIVAAKNEKEHDAIMLALLKRAKEKGVCFNRDKIQFKVNSVRYMGHLVTEHGLKPDDEKINAIVNMPPPTDVPSLQRLLGMTKYLSQYIPNESTITVPLRELLKKIPNGHGRASTKKLSNV